MFNTLINFSLKQRLMVLAVSLLLLVYGALGLRALPVDVFPDLNKPTVRIMTEAHGMAPEEVEQAVTFPIETAMQGLPGVAHVRSFSVIGLSIVIVEFDWGTDIHRNRQQIAERLGQLPQRLPAGLLPHMGPISSIMGEIMLIALHRAKSTPMQVREHADWVVRPQLLNIPGVTQVTTMGGEVRQYRVTPNLALLREFAVHLEELEAALSSFSTNASGGFLDYSAQEYLIRAIAPNASLEDLRNLVIGAAVLDGTPVLLKQVASVGFAAQEKRGDGSFNGAPAVILSVQKQPGADTVRLTREIEVALVELNKNSAAIASQNILFKQANFIENAINNVKEALLYGAVMVAVICFYSWLIFAPRSLA